MIEILTTDVFDDWFAGLKDVKTKARIQARLKRLQIQHHFGDVKMVQNPVCEMRFFFGAGLRIYYVQHGETVVVLLAGGDKSSQNSDIERATTLAYEVLQQLSGENDGQTQ